ncbi:MAG: CBU_0585 family protein [Gammaproteobacteria bacterium]
MTQKKSNYISEIDQFLVEFGQTHPPSDPQRKEIAKHKRIADLRDRKKRES